MHHTNLWSTKHFLSDWRFALYLHFPYLRFPPMRIRTCVFRTCVFQYLRFQRPPLNVAFVRRMLDVSLCWVVFDMFVRKCIRFDTCVYSVGLGTLSVACKVAWLVAGQLADIFKSPNSEMTMSGYIWCIFMLTDFITFCTFSCNLINSYTNTITLEIKPKTLLSWPSQTRHLVDTA